MSDIKKSGTTSGSSSGQGKTKADVENDGSTTVSVKSGQNEETITTKSSAPKGGSGGTAGAKTTSTTTAAAPASATAPAGGDAPPSGADDSAPSGDGLGSAADAVAAANVLAVGESPAMAMSMIYQAMAEAAAARMQNATLQQATANTILQTVTLKGVEQLLGSGQDTTTTATTLLAGEVNDSTVSALAKAIVDRLASQPTT